MHPFTKLRSRLEHLCDIIESPRYVSVYESAIPVDGTSFSFRERTISILPSPCEFEPLLQSISIPRILSQNQLLAWSTSLNFHAARHSVNLRDSCEVLLDSNSIFLFGFTLQSKLASHSRHCFTNLCRICRLLQESCAAVLVTAMDEPRWTIVL